MSNSTCNAFEACPGGTLSQPISLLASEVQQIPDTRLSNTYASISRLPPELLGQIFVLVKASRGFYIRLMICRHWRAVALGMPSLWCTIDVSTPSKSVQLYLQHARDAPLDLRLDLTHAWQATQQLSAALAIVGGRATQVRSLELEGIPGLHSKQIQTLIAALGQMRQLEALRVGATEKSWAPRCAEVLRDLQPGRDQLPAIRHIALDPGFLPWTSSLLSGLVTLNLAALPDALRPSLHTFLDALEACPDLEALHLSYAGPRRDDAVSLVTRAVNLRRLRTLAIADDVRTVHWQLSHLCLPPSCCTTVHAAVDVSSELAWHSALPPTAGDTLGLRDTCRVSLRVGDKDHMRIGFLKDDGEPLLRLEYCSAKAVGPGLLVQLAANDLTTVCPDACGLTQFEARMPWNLDAKDWTRIVRPMSHLGSVRIVLDGEIAPVLQALTVLHLPALKEVYVLSSSWIPNAYVLEIAQNFVEAHDGLEVLAIHEQSEVPWPHKRCSRIEERVRVFQWSFGGMSPAWMKEYVFDRWDYW